MIDTPPRLRRTLYGTDSLVTLANGAGTLATVGPLGVNTDIYAGFQIATNSLGVDTAYALLTPPSGIPCLYTINLASGHATLVGALGFTNQVYSLAIIPSPASALPLAFVILVACFRRRRPD